MYQGEELLLDRVAMYLRKSRADLDAEARGEGETLEKHRKILEDLAKEKGYNVVKIYKEIASGESIAHRPEMIKLLDNVKRGLYDAVLVVDIDRLGRGNMQDQGVILDTFKSSKTKIITPRKVYDLDNEFDEEYSEFEAFLARKEFKIIKRRLNQGRIRSVKDGNYIGARPPYGYQKVVVDGKPTLVPDPDQAKIVKLIFEWYTSDDPQQRAGTVNIAHRLDDMGVPAYYGGKWSKGVILQILRNPVYIGKIAWGKVERKKSDTPGKGVDTRLRPVGEQILVDGNHPPIIDEKLFQKAQEIRRSKSHPRYDPDKGLQNPLAGLIFCEICGGTLKMFRLWGRKNRHRYLRCNNRGRGGHCNRNVRLEHVEKRIIDELRKWLKQYEAELTITENDLNASKLNEGWSHYEIAIKTIEEELSKLKSQKDKLHDLVERGIYDEQTFIERNKRLTERIKDNQKKLDQLIEDYEAEKERQKARVKVIPQVKNIIDIYKQLDDPEKKNILLKQIIDKCTYLKTKDQYNDQFSLKIYLKI